MSDTPEPSFSSEPSMWDLDESWAAMEPESTTTSSKTYQRFPKGLDLENLSPRGQAIKLLVADELADGQNLATLATELGLSASSVSTLLEELRSEIELQGGPVAPLSTEEYNALKESIASEGVKVPVIIGTHTIIDGRNRWRICRELGIKEIPAIFVVGLTADQERDYCIAVNVVRRHVSREQKQALVRAEITRDPSRSSRRIAQLCGVTHPTVEAMRQKMRQEAEAVPTQVDIDAAREFVKRPERRVDSLGRTFEVQIRKEQENRPLAFLYCEKCKKRHALFRTDGKYSLEGS